jgi:nicotinamide-nucleotide amidase
MADGLISGGNCDVSISTTGIAGPKSDNTNKPVGLIYIGIGTHDNVSVYKYNLDGNRDNITNTAINLALFLAYKHLK